MASSLVKKLTVDDTSIMSAYAMKELADITLRSFADCENVRELLLARLEKPSPDVKYKTLRAIKYVAQNGRIDFRISLQRKSTSIKQCQTFRAPADPLRGDAPSERVREAAREALEAVFSENTTTSTSSTLDTDRIKGFGGGEAPPSAAGSSDFNLSTASASSLFTAIKTKVVSTVSDLATSDSSRQGYNNGVFSGGADQASSSSQSTTSAPVSKSRYGAMGSDGSYNPGLDAGSISASNSSNYASYNHSSSTYNSTSVSTSVPSSTGRTRGAIGGGWDDDDGKTSLSKPSTLPSSQHGFGLGPSSAVSPKTVPSVTSSSNTHEPGPYETKLIDDLTAPTGIRAGLTPQEKSLFLSKCASLDNHAVSICLDRKLSSNIPLASVIKALFLLDSLLQSGSDDADDYFNDHPKSLFALEHHTNKTIQTLVLKCLILLGLRDKSTVPAASPSASAAAAPAIAPASFDLFSSLMNQASPAAASTPSTAPKQANTGDLDNIFGSLAITPQQQAPSHQQEAPSSFDFLSETTTSGSAASAPAPASSSGGFDDIFGMLNAPSTSTTSSSNVSAFDSLLSDSKPQASSQSNFDFLNTSNQTTTTNSHSSYNNDDDIFANLTASPSTQNQYSQKTAVVEEDPFAFINNM